MPRPVPILTAHNATLATATVEIKTLTVGARQLTQAVFRQIPRECLLARDLSPRGVIWGHVNYFWDDALPREPALPRRHLLWQKGEELRRWIPCEVYPWLIEDGKGGVSSDEQTGRQEQYLDFLKSLRDIPQLFIAV